MEELTPGVPEDSRYSKQEVLEDSYFVTQDVSQAGRNIDHHTRKQK